MDVKEADMVESKFFLNSKGHLDLVSVGLSNVVRRILCGYAMQCAVFHFSVGWREERRVSPGS